MMRSVKQRNRDKRQRTRMRRHKASILSICGVNFIIDNHIVGGKYVTSGKEQAL